MPSLIETLTVNRSDILTRWREIVISSYPDDSVTFLERQKDKFLNPVGHTIDNEIETLYDAILFNMEADKLLNALENIVKIRAVQDFTPSEAVGFIYRLKDIILGYTERISAEITFDEIRSISEKVDKMALLAFDIYMKYRERIYQLRLDQIKKSMTPFYNNKATKQEDPAK